MKGDVFPYAPVVALRGANGRISTLGLRGQQPDVNPANNLCSVQSWLFHMTFWALTVDIPLFKHRPQSTTDFFAVFHFRLKKPW